MTRLRHILGSIARAPFFRGAAFLAGATCIVTGRVALAAQTPVPLGTPEVEFREPFTQITSVRELKDGRVLVLDTRDRTLQLIDLRSGAMTRIGREGSGPGEYLRPQRIIALPSDTSVFFDPPNARFVLIGPGGTMGAAFRLDEMTTGRLGIHHAPPKGSDARGRLFAEGSQFTITAAGAMVPADSTPVVRFDRGTMRIDTITHLRLASGNASVTVKQDNISRRVGQIAFASRDDWVPLASGAIAVVRASDYHIDVYSPTGIRTSGRPIAVEAIPVTAADKAEWVAARQAVRGMTTGRGNTPAGAPPLDSRSTPQFPAFKPPFVHGEVFARPNGEVWILRSRKARDKIPAYDVVNATGTMIRRVAFPAKTRLIGFGNGTAYVVRSDADDLQYLQRYKLP
jgi:hypothetical protein